MLVEDAAEFGGLCGVAVHAAVPDDGERRECGLRHDEVGTREGVAAVRVVECGDCGGEL